MVKQREGYKFIITEPAKTWLAENKCAGCGKPQSEWKRSTRWKCCSTECTEKYVRECTSFGWGEFRLRVFKRDNYTCAKCKQKPTPMRYEYNIAKQGYMWMPIDPTEATAHDYARMLIADHIHPIALGGDEWDINNIQTLCKECNKLKTKKDIGKIAQLRTKETLERMGQKFLDEIGQDEKL